LSDHITRSASNSLKTQVERIHYSDPNRRSRNDEDKVKKGGKNKTTNTNTKTHKNKTTTKQNTKQTKQQQKHKVTHKTKNNKT
jgi:hypothetical protein